MVDKSSIKPATTWRLERLRQRMQQQQLQQQQQHQEDQESSIDNNQAPQWNPKYQDLEDPPQVNNATDPERRVSVGKLVPTSNERHDSTFTMYSDASDRFSFDHSHNRSSTASSTGSNSNINKDLRIEPILPRSSNNTTNNL